MVVAVALCAAAPAYASEPGHPDPVAAVVLSLALILVGAKLGGDLATRAGQPPVLGELLAGVIFGNLPLVGIFVNLPLESLDRLSLQRRLDDIGRDKFAAPERTR